MAGKSRFDRKVWSKSKARSSWNSAQIRKARVKHCQEHCWMNLKTHQKLNEFSFFLPAAKMSFVKTIFSKWTSGARNELSVDVVYWFCIDLYLARTTRLCLCLIAFSQLPKFIVQVASALVIKCLLRLSLLLNIYLWAGIMRSLQALTHKPCLRFMTELIASCFPVTVQMSDSRTVWHSQLKS